MPNKILLVILFVCFCLPASAQVDKTREFRRVIAEQREVELQLERDDLTTNERQALVRKRSVLRRQANHLKPHVVVLLFGIEPPGGGYGKTTFAAAEQAGHTLRYDYDVEQYFALTTKAELLAYQRIKNNEIIRGIVEMYVSAALKNPMPHVVEVPPKSASITIYKYHGDRRDLSYHFKTTPYRLSVTRDRKIKLSHTIYVNYPDGKVAFLKPRLEETKQDMIRFFADYDIVLDITFLHGTGDAAREEADVKIDMREKGKRGITFNAWKWALWLDGTKLSRQDRCWTFVHEYLHMFGFIEEYMVENQALAPIWQ